MERRLDLELTVSRQVYSIQLVDAVLRLLSLECKVDNGQKTQSPNMYLVPTKSLKNAKNSRKGLTSRQVRTSRETLIRIAQASCSFPRIRFVYLHDLDLHDTAPSCVHVCRVGFV